jgi:crossover junction endodeoxyribonuclease RuvC
MLSRMLELGGELKPLDVTDALGIAYCDLARGASSLGGQLRKNGKGRSKGWAAFVNEHPELMA